jgi:hypothetical protein
MLMLLGEIGPPGLEYGKVRNGGVGYAMIYRQNTRLTENSTNFAVSSLPVG